jgi:signal transduction histidine kinase
MENADSLTSQALATGGMRASFRLGTFVNIDEHRFDQVARNLVTNAVKFCPPEIGLVEVKTFTSSDVSEVSSTEVAGAKLVGSLRLEVTDNGAGIATESQSQVFHEFSQFKKNKLQGGSGSGLGLWICREIIRLHGGTLNFTSQG